jgi:hypothetical protein
VVFQPPTRVAPAVRDLWGQASDEERTRAHKLCMSILEYWLGRTSKEDLAVSLGLPPVRVWQLSQQALSGMLAGLLRQPRRRVKVVADPADPEIDPKPLRQRIAELETKLARTEDLVRVLKHLPWTKEGRDGAQERPTAERGSRTKAKERERAARDRPLDPGERAPRRDEAR